MSARDAVLARVRHALPRAAEAQSAAEAAVSARLETHARNLIPARGQLNRDGRVQLFVELKALQNAVASLEVLASAGATA